MSEPNLNFLFNIHTIRATSDAPPQSFSIVGLYKPPTESHHIELVDSTGWFQWSMDSVSRSYRPPPAQISYATSVFYDHTTGRFLFYPGDCRRKSILMTEREGGEEWGWQQLKFKEVDTGHCALNDKSGNGALCGRGGSYSPNFLSDRYWAQNGETRQCGLSGKMSLLLALTAFSCEHIHMIDAIKHRLNIREQRWDDVETENWGDGKTYYCHGRGLVVEIKGDENLDAWEEGIYRPLLW